MAEPASGMAERRRDPRFPAVEKDAYLSWYEGKKVMLCSARLADISRGGALVVAPSPLAAGKMARLGLNRATGGVDAVVVAATPKDPGEFEVRLQFADLCPDPFFHAAVRGIDAEGR
jgi:hypothetical protein